MALCITTENSRQRMLRSSLSLSVTMSRPRNSDLPADDLRRRAQQLRDREESVDLPQPDSPTMPRNSPRRKLEIDAVDGDDRPAVGRYATDRSRTSRIASVSVMCADDACSGTGRRAGLLISSKA